MSTTLAQAFQEAAALPADTQEYIGQAVLNRVHAIERLRAQIEIGMRSIDEGRVSKLDIDTFIKEIRARHAK